MLSNCSIKFSFFLFPVDLRLRFFLYFFIKKSRFHWKNNKKKKKENECKLSLRSEIYFLLYIVCYLLKKYSIKL